MDEAIIFVFVVTLIVTVVAVILLLPERRAQERPSPVKSRSPTVLVVDDDAFVRATVMRILRFNGITPIAAADGEEGLQQLKTYAVDAIILDLSMAGMSGAEFRARQLLDPTIRNIPAMILSGHVVLSTDLEALGIFYQLPKPFEIAELLETVEKMVVSYRSN